MKTRYLAILLLFILFACKENSFTLDVEILKQSQQLYPIEQAGQYGLINELGEVVLTAQYDRPRAENNLQGIYSLYGQLFKAGHAPLDLPRERQGYSFVVDATHFQNLWVYILRTEADVSKVYQQEQSFFQKPYSLQIKQQEDNYLILHNIENDSHFVFDHQLQLIYQCKDLLRFEVHPRYPELVFIKHAIEGQAQGYQAIVNFKEQTKKTIDPELRSVFGYRYDDLFNSFWRAGSDTILVLGNGMYAPKKWRRKRRRPRYGRLDSFRVYHYYNHQLDPIQSPPYSANDLVDGFPHYFRIARNMHTNPFHYHLYKGEKQVLKNHREIYKDRDFPQWLTAFSIQGNFKIYYKNNEVHRAKIQPRTIALADHYLGIYDYEARRFFSYIIDNKGNKIHESPKGTHYHRVENPIGFETRECWVLAVQRDSLYLVELNSLKTAGLPASISRKYQRIQYCGNDLFIINEQAIYDIRSAQFMRSAAQLPPLAKAPHARWLSPDLLAFGYATLHLQNNSIEELQWLEYFSPQDSLILQCSSDFYAWRCAPLQEDRLQPVYNHQGQILAYLNRQGEQIWQGFDSLPPSVQLLNSREAVFQAINSMQCTTKQIAFSKKSTAFDQIQQHLKTNLKALSDQKFKLSYILIQEENYEAQTVDYYKNIDKLDFLKLPFEEGDRLLIQVYDANSIPSKRLKCICYELKNEKDL